MAWRYYKQAFAIEEQCLPLTSQFIDARYQLFWSHENANNISGTKVVLSS